MTGKRYSLPRHIYVRVSERGAIWLDIRKDKYTGQRHDQLLGLSTIVDGWPATADDKKVSPDIATANAERLVAAGFLIADTSGKSAAPALLAEPSAVLLQEADVCILSVTHVIRFWRSCSAVDAAFKQSFENALERTRKRKATHMQSWNDESFERARKLLAIFRRLRTYRYTAQERCLRDSFVLLEFLSHYNLFPTLAIGVQFAPFASHCWVQQGTRVFNDHPSHAQLYRPILAI